MLRTWTTMIPDALSLTARCWTPEDRQALADVKHYCGANAISLIVIGPIARGHNDQYVILNLAGSGPAFHSLKKHVEEKYNASRH